MHGNGSSLPPGVTLAIVALATLLVAAAVWLFVSRAGVLAA
jgi:hypothetical protein